MIKRINFSSSLLAGKVLSNFKRLLVNPHFIFCILTVIFISYVYYDWYYRYYWFWKFSVFEFRNDMIGSLFFAPIIYGALIFWLRGFIIIWLLSFVAILPRIIYFSLEPAELITNISFFLIPLALIVIISLEVQWRRRQREMLALREQERQLYTLQILQAQEDERHRIAQELHDDTTQGLLVIANHAQQIAKSDACTEKQEQLFWIRDSILKLAEDVRRLSLNLRPSILDDIGLVPALRWLVDHTYKETGINTTMLVVGNIKKLPTNTEVTVYRIVQEALSNVRRHSNAQNAKLALTFNENFLEIIIEDDGQGFKLGDRLSKLATKQKLGLLGIRHRTHFIGGTYEIASQPERGTFLKVNIPIQAMEDGSALKDVNY